MIRDPRPPRRPAREREGHHGLVPARGLGPGRGRRGHGGGPRVARPAGARLPVEHGRLPHVEPRRGHHGRGDHALGRHGFLCARPVRSVYPRAGDRPAVPDGGPVRGAYLPRDRRAAPLRLRHLPVHEAVDLPGHGVPDPHPLVELLDEGPLPRVRGHRGDGAAAYFRRLRGRVLLGVSALRAPRHRRQGLFRAHLHDDVPVVGPVLGHAGSAPRHARHLRGHLRRARRRVRAPRARPVLTAALVQSTRHRRDPVGMPAPVHRRVPQPVPGERPALRDSREPRRRGAGCLRDHLHACGRDQHAVAVRLPSAAHPHGAAMGGGQARGVFRDRSPRPPHDRGRIRPRRARHLRHRRSAPDPRVWHGRVRLCA